MVKKINAAHILVKSEDVAKSILEELNSGKKFHVLAMEKSTCPSRKKGGELGYFGRGQMVKEFENACFKAKKGDILGPIKTQFGWHLIKVIDMK